MLMVLSCHCWIHPVGKAIPVRLFGLTIDTTAPFHFGYLGVHLFLVLSGFCLTYPLARKGLRLELAQFARRRASRILPPYYVALALFALQRAAAHQRPSARDLLSHLLMVYNFSPTWMGSINGSFWSLALEWQLYLLLPLLLWGFRRWGVPQTLLATLALTLAYRTWVWNTKDVSTWGSGMFWCYSVPGRMFEFALGMAAAVALSQPSRAGQAHGARRYAVGLISFGLIGLAAASLWSPFAPVTDVLWGMAFFSLLMLAGRRAAEGRHSLTWRPLVGLGTISYSVYLVHAPLLKQLAAALRPRHLPPAGLWLLFELVVGPMLIGVGWLFYQAVEAPCLRMRRGRRPGETHSMGQRAPSAAG
jgi:peptidoglycan/LPS O-acetylase OafA/YrhL